MLDKTVEQSRAKYVARKFPTMLADLGFEKKRGASCMRVVDGHTWHVWLQKFRNQPAFRVAMSFKPADSERWVTEFADPWTYRGNQSGRQFDFSIRRGDDAADRCLSEIREFVELIALPWFARQSAAAKPA